MRFQHDLERFERAAKFGTQVVWTFHKVLHGKRLLVAYTMLLISYGPTEKYVLN